MKYAWLFFLGLGAVQGWADTMPARGTRTTVQTSTVEVTDTKVLEDQMMEELGLPPLKSSVEPRTCEERIYVAAFGGINVHTMSRADADLDPFVSGLGKFRFDDDVDIGPMFGIKVGRTFKRFSIGGETVPDPDKFHFLAAAEGEVFYNTFSMDGSIEDDGTFPAGTSLTVDGDLNMVVASANGILKMQWHWFRPYIGLGIGFANIWTDNANLKVVNPLPPPPPGNFKNSADDFVLAGQGLAGVEFQLHEDWAIFAEYKFLYLHDPCLEGKTVDLDYDYIAQSFVTAGLKFYLP